MISLKKKLLMAGGLSVGQVVFAGPGSRKWRCPNNVRSVSVVCVGAGANGGNNRGGGGGGLGWANNIAVVPGQEYDVVINGTNSYFISPTQVRGIAGSSTTGGGFTGQGGGKGGDAFVTGSDRAGGGGAGGYSGNGGNGAGPEQGQGSPGAGGGAAGGTFATSDNFSGGGGGVGLLGQGASGLSAGQAGSGGVAGGSMGGGEFGGGGPKDAGDGSRLRGGRGAVRIIWGKDRAFPATNTGDR